MSFPLCTSDLGPDWIDAGTSTRTRCGPPGSTGIAVNADAGVGPDGGANGGPDAGKLAAPRVPNPPPITQTSKTSVKKMKDAETDYDVSVEVVADASDATLPAGTAETTFDNDVMAVTPVPAWEEKNGKKIVTKIAAPLSVKGVMKIHTRYGTGATANQPSGYGRGTTEEDIKAGNTSLGFHESCHRVDLLSYATTTPLPKFAGKVGMDVDTFDQAGTEFRAQMGSYFTTMQSQSELKTDEVGYTKAKYEANGPRVSP
jgi:hypothetical protein